MRKFYKNKKILLFYATVFLFVCGAAFIPDITQAFELFPGEGSSLQDYRVFIQNFYRFSIAASILIATVMIMIGGVIWITSAGDQSRIGKAREYIINSIIGVVLLMGAYVILAVINPNLVELKKVSTADLGSWQECEDGSVISKDEKCAVEETGTGNSQCSTSDLPIRRTLDNQKIIDTCNSYCDGRKAKEGETCGARIIVFTEKYTCKCVEGGAKVTLDSLVPPADTKGSCMKGEDTDTCIQNLTREDCNAKDGYTFLINTTCTDIRSKEENGACSYEKDEPGILWGTNIVKKCENLSKTDCSKISNSNFKSGLTCEGEGLKTEFDCSRSPQYVTSSWFSSDENDCTDACNRIDCKWTGANPNETAAGLLECRCQAK